MRDVARIERNIYPNPVAVGEPVLVQLQSDESVTKATLYNVQGVELANQRSMEVRGNQLRLSTVDLSPGIYFLEIGGKEGLSTNKLVVR